MRAFVADSDDDGDDLGSDTSNNSPPSRAKAAAPTRTTPNSLVILGESPELTLPSPCEEDELHFEMSASKRRKTGPEPQFSPSPKKVRRTKTIATYGKTKSKRGDHPNGSTSPLKTQESILFSSSNTPAPSIPKDGEEGAAVGGVWELPATLQNDFAQHDPNSMFPDQSSTIPDNTATQRRLVDDVIDALRRPQEVIELSLTDHTTQKTDDTPIPWSDFLTTPSGKQSIDNTVEQELAVSPITEINEEPQNIVEPQVVIEPRVVSVRNSPEVDIPVNKQKVTKVASLEPNADPLNSEDLAIGLPKEQYKPRPSRSRALRITEDGLATTSISSKRPSRASRRKTTAGVVEPPSFQKIEQICEMGFSPFQARQALESCGGFVDDAIVALCNSKSVVSEGSKTFDANVTAQRGRVEDAEDKLTGENIVHDRVTSAETGNSERPELPGAAQKKHTLSRKKSKSIHEGEDRSKTPTAAEAEEEAINDIQKTLTPKPSRSASVRQRKKSQVVDDSDDDVDVDPVDEGLTRADAHDGHQIMNEGDDTTVLLESTAMPDTTQTKPQRGRVRPKKAAAVIEEAQTVDIDESSKQPRARGRLRKHSEPTVHDDRGVESVATSRLADHEAHNDSPPVKEDIIPVAQAFYKGSSAGHEKPPENTKDKTDVPPATPPLQGANSDTNAPKTAPPHSPLNKGKVPYRVGLSKRARIAPLLRVVKK